MGKTVAGLFAEFVEGLEIDALSGGVLNRAKLSLLDFLGACLAGGETPAGQRIIKYVVSLNAGQEASILGTQERTASYFAALCNGTMGHHLELDDGHRRAHTHPAVTIIPAALALAEKTRSSGSRFLAAVISGYEVVNRIGRAVSPSLTQDRPFHGPGVLGSFGAAAAAAKILGFKADLIEAALGNCCLGPVAPFETFKSGSSSKDLYGGWPAFVGVFAALLAAAGFRGPSSILDGELGFAKVVADRHDWNIALQGLGREFEIEQTYFKPYAACRQLHSGIDGALAIKRENNLPIDQIEKILVRTFYPASRGTKIHPENAISAKYSLPYCISAGLVHDSLGPEKFSDECRKDPRILSLSEKVEVQKDASLCAVYKERESSIVQITTKSGKIYEKRVDWAKGEPENPLTRDEIVSKFVTLSGKKLGRERTSQVVHICETLDSCAEITELISRLNQRGRGPFQV